MDNLKWIFDGIGTAVVVFILGLLLGGTAGYKIAIKESIRQKQKAGDNSKQIQIGKIEDGR